MSARLNAGAALAAAEFFQLATSNSTVPDHDISGTTKGNYALIGLGGFMFIVWVISPLGIYFGNRAKFQATSFHATSVLFMSALANVHITRLKLYWYYLRVLVETLQFVAFVFRLPIPWTIQTYVIQIIQTLFNFYSEGSYKVSFWVAFGVVVLAFAWYFAILVRQRYASRYTMQLSLNSGVGWFGMEILFYMLSIPVFSALIQVFNCTYFSSGEVLLEQDRTVACWEGMHWLYVVFAAVALLPYYVLALYTSSIMEFNEENVVRTSPKYTLAYMQIRFLLCCGITFFNDYIYLWPMIAVLVASMLLLLGINLFFRGVTNIQQVRWLRVIGLVYGLWTASAGLVIALLALYGKIDSVTAAVGGALRVSTSIGSASWVPIVLVAIGWVLLAPVCLAVYGARFWCDCMPGHNDDPKITIDDSRWKESLLAGPTLTLAARDAELRRLDTESRRVGQSATQLPPACSDVFVAPLKAGTTIDEIYDALACCGTVEGIALFRRKKSKPSELPLACRLKFTDNIGAAQAQLLSGQVSIGGERLHIVAYTQQLEQGKWILLDSFPKQASSSNVAAPPQPMQPVVGFTDMESATSTYASASATPTASAPVLACVPSAFFDADTATDADADADAALEGDSTPYSASLGRADPSTTSSLADTPSHDAIEQP